MRWYVPLAWWWCMRGVGRSQSVAGPDFGCGYDGSLLQHGRLFLTQNYICFYSSLFGSDVKHVMPLANVTGIRKTTKAFVIPALEVHLNDGVCCSARYWSWCRYKRWRWLAPGGRRWRPFRTSLQGPSEPVSAPPPGCCKSFGTGLRSVGSLTLCPTLASLAVSCRACATDRPARASSPIPIQPARHSVPSMGRRRATTSAGHTELRQPPMPTRQRSQSKPTEAALRVTLALDAAAAGVDTLSPIPLEQFSGSSRHRQQHPLTRTRSMSAGTMEALKLPSSLPRGGGTTAGGEVVVGSPTSYDSGTLSDSELHRGRAAASRRGQCATGGGGSNHSNNINGGAGASGGRRGSHGQDTAGGTHNAGGSGAGAGGSVGSRSSNATARTSDGDEDEEAEDLARPVPPQDLEESFAKWELVYVGCALRRELGA